MSRTQVGLIAVQDEYCTSEALSPDGRVLACVDPEGTLRLIDVASGNSIFEKKQFGQRFWNIGESCEPAGTLPASCTPQFPAEEWGDPGSATFDFSPDSRFVVAIPGNLSRGSPVAFDSRERRPVVLTGTLKGVRSFSFIAPDRVVISRPRKGWLRTRSAWTNALVVFPTGLILLKLATLPPGPLFRATDPDFVLIRASGSSAVDYRSGYVIASDTSALDVFGNLYVTERPHGRLGLFERGKGLHATITLADR